MTDSKSLQGRLLSKFTAKLGVSDPPRAPPFHFTIWDLFQGDGQISYMSFLRQHCSLVCLSEGLYACVCMYVCMHISVCVLTEGRHGSSAGSFLVIRGAAAFVSCAVVTAPHNLIGFLSRKHSLRVLEAGSPRPRCRSAGLAPLGCERESRFCLSPGFSWFVGRHNWSLDLRKHDLNLRLYLHMPFRLCACLGPRSPFSLGPQSSFH